MKVFHILFVFLVVYAGCLTSCQKEFDFNPSVRDSLTNNPGMPDNNNSACNNTVLKIKRFQSLFDSLQYIAAEWNADGTIKMIEMNTLFSEHKSATYLYANGGIKEAVLRLNEDNKIWDTVVFHYNAGGKVDSMYLKNSPYFNIKLSYNSDGKLIKYSRYSKTDIMVYWDIKTDTKDNIVEAVEYAVSTSGASKQSTMNFTRDDRKNPFSGLAPYMFYLDDDYNIFWHWGANNFIDQKYVDHTGTGIDIMSGYKFKYNPDCYPVTSQNTISGMVLFTDDDFRFTYY